MTDYKNNDFAEANTSTRNENSNRDRRPHNPRWNNNRPHNPARAKNRGFFRAGQVFSTIYHLALLAFAYNLVQSNEQELAFKILALNAGLIAFAFLLSAAERKFSPKPNFKGKRDNRERGGNRDGYRSSAPQRRSR